VIPENNIKLIKNIILLLFSTVSLQCFGQQIPYVFVETGGSYIDMKYFTTPPSNLEHIKGFVFGGTIGLGFIPKKNGNMGANISYSYYNIPSKPDLENTEYRKQTKISFSLTSRLDIKKFTIEPFITTNRYQDNSHIYENKNFKFEYGSNLILRKDRIWYKLTIRSFPEFDFGLPYSETEPYYRKSSLHIPYFGVGINYLLINPESIPYNEEPKDTDEKLNSFELNYMSLSVGFGFKHLFRNKKNRNVRLEFGIRSGLVHYKDMKGALLTNFYFGNRYKWKENPNKNSELNWGFELGGNVLFDDFINDLTYIIPFPHFMGFIEKSFSDYYFRFGAGTGFYGTIGFKI
jgi:hypothetical protein